MIKIIADWISRRLAAPKPSTVLERLSLSTSGRESMALVRHWTLQTFKGPANGVGYQRDDQHQIVITCAPTAGHVRKEPPTPNRPVKPPSHAPEELSLMGTEDRIAYSAALKKYSNDLADYNRQMAKKVIREHNAEIVRRGGTAGPMTLPEPRTRTL